MRPGFCTSLAALSLLAGCSGVPAPATPSAPVITGAGVRFTKKPPSVGTVIVTRERNETRMEMDITVDGKARHSSSVVVQTVERRAEVLAMGADGAPTRIRVAYQTNHKEEAGKGPVAAPVEGKTYLVEGHGGDAPSVTDAAGNPPSEAEAKAVATDFKHLGRVDPFWHGLPERPLAAGERVDDMAKVVLADDAADGLEQVQLHFEGPRDVRGSPAGVFAVQVSGKLAGDTPVTVDGKVALLLASGWEAESDADIPLDISQQQTRDGSAVSIVAHGKMHLHTETSYEGK
jgi:hypothetical protein